MANILLQRALRPLGTSSAADRQGGTSMRRKVFACTATCLSSLVLAALGCSSSDSDMSGVSGAPGNYDASTSPRPPDGAPTGQRWQGIAVEDGCGRTRIQYVLVDETCAGYDRPDYARAFQAPMFRDGAVVGGHLLAVDATHLWSLDVGTNGEPMRRRLLSGIGLPLAVDTFGTMLTVAAGDSGLVLVDAAAAAAPVRSGQVTLPGFAADVEVEGTKAYVAMGTKGIGVVDLAVSPPALVDTIPVPNAFSAGVRVKGTHAYVAACSTFAVVDLVTKSVVGRTWRADALDARNVLVAPAKDVDIVGDVAFVAAGRYGAVAIDVSQPTSPTILGNCTQAADPAFYASGVRSEGNALYVAAGEYGVERLDVTTPLVTCTQDSPPVTKKPAPKTDCTAEAPWEIVPWEQLWAPPPPRKDPIQTRPAGDRLYAFGDARRIGTRAVDVRDTTQASMPIVHRYDEPRALVGIAASASRVVAVGKGGGVFSVSGSSLTRVTSTADSTLREATAVTMTADGKWAALKGQDVIREDGSAVSVGPVNGEVLVADGHQLFVVASDKVLRIDGANVVPIPVSTSGAKLPPSLAVAGTTAYFAAPESSQVIELSPSPVVLPSHDIFAAQSLDDAALWQERLPRHLLAVSNAGLVEVAGVGPHAGVAVRGASGIRTTALPSATYGAITATGNRVVTAGIDRGLYRTTLVTLSIATGSPVVVGTEVFSGVASALAAWDTKLYVADADGRIRIYDGAGATFAHAADVSVEVP